MFENHLQGLLDSDGKACTAPDSVLTAVQGQVCMEQALLWKPPGEPIESEPGCEVLLVISLCLSLGGDLFISAFSTLQVS